MHELWQCTGSTTVLACARDHGESRVHRVQHDHEYGQHDCVCNIGYYPNSNDGACEACLDGTYKADIGDDAHEPWQ